MTPKAYTPKIPSGPLPPGSGEPSYDESHARDGENQFVIGICSDKCDIGAQDFTSHIMIFTCYDLLNDTIALYFSTLVSFYYLFRVDGLVWSRDNLTFYL